MNLNRDPQTENKPMVAGQSGGVGRDSWGLWEGHVHTTIFKMDSRQKPTVWHMELCSLLLASLDDRGGWQRMDTCIRMAESLCCPPEIIATLLIGYTSIQDKKFKVKKKKKI